METNRSVDQWWKSPVPWIGAIIWFGLLFGAYRDDRPLVSLILANMAVTVWFLGAACVDMARLGK